MSGRWRKVLGFLLSGFTAFAVLLAWSLIPDLPLGEAWLVLGLFVAGALLAALLRAPALAVGGGAGILVMLTLSAIYLALRDRLDLKTDLNQFMMSVSIAGVLIGLTMGFGALVGLWLRERSWRGKVSRKGGGLSLSEGNDAADRKDTDV